MRIAICDDDVRILTYLCKLISHWARTYNEEAQVEVFESAESFLLNSSDPASFDLLLLDIKMKGMSGMDLAEEIRKTDPNLLIAFVTANKDYAPQSYDVDALHYLVKPITQQDMDKCLAKAKERLRANKNEVFVVNAEGKLLRKRFDEIEYFESLAHYIQLYTAHEALRFRMNISTLVEELNSQSEFVRIHRSYIVNLKHVSLVDDASVTLDNGKQLPVSRSYRRDTYKAFMKHHAGNLR